MLGVKRNHRIRARERGFTLIELVVVLAILGVLLSIALPMYLGARKRAYKAEADHLLLEVKTLSWMYYQEHDIFPPDASVFPLQTPANSHWTDPSISSGAGSDAAITWVMQGSLPPLTTSDECSVVLSGTGAVSQGCNF